MPLPDYRRLAAEAKAAHEFDYAAYMVLRNGVYDSVERVAKTRQNLVPEWRPSPATNEAVLLTLEVYRDKQQRLRLGVKRHQPRTRPPSRRLSTPTRWYFRSRRWRRGSGGMRRW